MEHNERFIHGGAAWASPKDIKKAGLYRRPPGAIFVGYAGKRPIFSSGFGSIAMFAPPGSGKMTRFLAWNSCGPYNFEGHVVFNDLKGEIYIVAQNQMFDGNELYAFNPSGQFGIPSVRLNPVGHIKRGSFTLYSDCASFATAWLDMILEGNARFFELSAHEILTALSYCVANRDGELTLSALHRVVNKIASTDSEWLNFEFELLHSEHTDLQRIGRELKQYRKQLERGLEGRGAGLPATIKEITTSFACLNEPSLRETVSPPFDLDLADFSRSGVRRKRLHFIIPEQNIETWGRPLRATYDRLITERLRNPSEGEPIAIFFDEAGQYKKFATAKKLSTLVRSGRIRPVFFFQTINQPDQLFTGGKDEILASTSCKIFMNLADLHTAEMVSNMLGYETREYNDKLQQREGAREARRHLKQILLGDMDTDVMAEYVHHKRALAHRSKIRRLLREPGEILGMDAQKMIVFMSESKYPLELDGFHYFQRKEMNGFWHPNPFHPPFDSITLPGRFRSRRHRVITGPVDTRFADLPQYANGTASWIEGYKP